VHRADRYVVCAQSRQLSFYMRRADSKCFKCTQQTMFMYTELTVSVVCAQGRQCCKWTQQTVYVVCTQMRQFMLYVHRADS